MYIYIYMYFSSFRGQSRSLLGDDIENRGQGERILLFHVGDDHSGTSGVWYSEYFVFCIGRFLFGRQHEEEARSRPHRFPHFCKNFRYPCWMHAGVDMP